MDLILYLRFMAKNYGYCFPPRTVSTCTPHGCLMRNPAYSQGSTLDDRIFSLTQNLGQLSHPVVVTLCAGQTLYVPRHWWHYVESLEPSISINVWVPVKDDMESRLSEAITRCLATSLITSLDTSEDNTLLSSWLNPTESLVPTTINLMLLKAALCHLLEDNCVRENSTTKIEEQDMSVLIQQGDKRKHQETQKSDDIELKSLQGVYSDDGRTSDGFCLTSGSVNAGFQHSVLTGDDCAEHCDKTFNQSLLSHFAEKLDGHKVINADTPFQFYSDADLTIEKRAGMSQGPSPKKCKLEPALLKEPYETSINFIDDKLISEMLHSRIFSLNSCLFDSYLKYLDILCRQIECRQCHGGSNVDINIQQLNDGNRIVCKSLAIPDSFTLNVCASSIPQEDNSRSEHGSHTDVLASVSSPCTPAATDGKYRKRKTVLDFHIDQRDKNDLNGSIMEGVRNLTDRNEVNSSKMEENLNLLSEKNETNSSKIEENLNLLSEKNEANSSKIEENLNLLSEKNEANSSKMEENLNLLSEKNEANSSKIEENNLLSEKNVANSSKIEENNLLSEKNVEDSNSDSTCNGPFSELSQQEVGETLLNCVLHPDVVKMISELFKEQCQDRLRQKLGLK